MRGFLSVFILLFLCHANAQGFSIANISQELMDDAYMVVRKDIQQVDFIDYNKLRYKRERAVTVLKESGLYKAYLPVDYNKFKSIKKFEASIYDASGNLIKKLKKRDLNDESVFDGFSLYTDRRIQYYDLNVASYPFTVHYQLEYETSSTVFMPDWYSVRGYNTGVEFAQFTINNSSGIEIRKKENNFEGWDILKSEEANRLTYSIKNVPPIEREIMSPPLRNLIPVVNFAPTEFQMSGIKGKFENWDQFGKWYYESLLKDKKDLTAGERETALKLIEGVSDPVEKIRILYQYMQSKTRYINVSIGIGGWEPFPASYVSDKSYGDCKALSNYMISLLDVAGIEGHYTVVYAETSGKTDIDGDFAAIDGNHVIVNVPLEEETIWLECTSQQSPFNYLGTFTDDRNAISVTPEGGRVVKTQKFMPDDNREVIKMKGEITPDGTLKTSLTIENTGLQYDNLSRISFADSKEQKENLIKNLAVFPNVKLLDYNFENDLDEAVFKTEIKLESPQFAKKVGNDLMLNLLSYGRSKVDIKKDRTRQFPFVIRYGYVDEAEVELKLPSGFKLSTEEPPRVYSSEFGSYVMTLTEPEPGILKVNRKLTVKDGQYPKDKFNDYVEFRRKISSLDNSKILLDRD